ncbi:MAG: DUF3500 domain-containing protein, partial [Anaerolineae bacterium]|nr:DUF3500 domain-containing protein [Anaerolineae bacterium]
MRTEKQSKTLISRRRFIQTGATVAAGLVAAACAGNPPAEQATPAEVAVQNTPTNTPLPPTATTAPTDTPLPPPTATDQATSEPPTAEPSPTPTDTVTIDHEQVLIAGMTQAAIAFWESLDPDQRNQAGYAFTSDERFRWHWTTPGNFPRNGLPLRQMSDDQKAQAHDLLQASLSSMGFEKSLNIISLQNDLGNDPELYFITLFGTPGDAEPWGWRWEGHHLSRQFTVIGDKVAVTPFFLGSWPTTTEAGLRAMTVEEDAALELINSFSADAQAAVIFQDR